jgi:phenolic acid decarboxylase
MGLEGWCDVAENNAVHAERCASVLYKRCFIDTLDTSSECILRRVFSESRQISDLFFCAYLHQKPRKVTCFKNLYLKNE